MEVGIFLYRPFWEEVENNNQDLIDKLSLLKPRYFVINASDMEDNGELNKLTLAVQLARSFRAKIIFRVCFYDWTIEHFGYTPNPLLTRWPTISDLLNFLELIHTNFPEIKYYEIGVEPVHYQTIDSEEKCQEFVESIKQARNYLKSVDPSIHVSCSGCSYKAFNFFERITPFLDSVDIHWYGGGQVNSLSDQELTDRAMNFWYPAHTTPHFSIEEMISIYKCIHCLTPKINILESGLTWYYQDPDPRLYGPLGGLWYLLNMKAYNWNIYTLFHFYGSSLAMIDSDGTIHFSYYLMKQLAEKNYEILRH